MTIHRVTAQTSFVADVKPLYSMILVLGSQDTYPHQQAKITEEVQEQSVEWVEG